MHLGPSTTLVWDSGFRVGDYKWVKFSTGGHTPSARLGPARLDSAGARLGSAQLGSARLSLAWARPGLAGLRPVLLGSARPGAAQLTKWKYPFYSPFPRCHFYPVKCNFDRY